MALRLGCLTGLACCMLWAQPPDPTRQLLERAYDALRAKDYAHSIGWFGKAIQAAPARADIRKDLAYAYLKVGETEAARDQFAEAIRLNPDDWHVALEYAFLCYETKQRAQARRTFDRIRRSGDAASRAKAEEAFQNIDRPLAEGIRRWSQALAEAPDNFSAHQELAMLAEQRDELELAAEHYWKALQLRPAEQSLLLDLGRVWTALGRTEQARGAYLAALQSSEPRVAEAARELLPARDRTAAPPGALEELVKVSGPPREMARFGAREMAERSYRAGYLNDALRYLKTAHEADPADFSVMLKLGWTYNALHQDQQAIRWFNMARRSPEAAIAAEAGKAYRNLRPALARFRTTAWAFPFYSSRWRDVFSYAQVKTELRLGRLPFRPYASTRFVGDTRRTTGEALPQYLSESSFLLALGLASSSWRGLTLWGEAGTAVSYLGRRNTGRMKPDYRGGAAFSNGLGQKLGGREPGLFFDTNADGVFVSRFQNDFLLYWQNRFGYTLPPLRGLQTQLYWNGNLTVDLQRQYWANFVEFGPGIRFRFAAMPKSLTFSVSLLRGVYTLNRDNPRRPNFFDLRAGFWYAVTR